MKLRFKVKHRNESSSSVDLTPMIDCVFLLLIFFMVSSTFIKDYKIDLERPKAASQERAQAKTVRVVISKKNDIYIDGKLTRIWTLQNIVKEKLSEANSKSVLVIADKNVTVEHIVEVVDQCKQGGASDVAVATDVETNA